MSKIQISRCNDYWWWMMNDDINDFPIAEILLSIFAIKNDY